MKRRVGITTVLATAALGVVGWVGLAQAGSNDLSGPRTIHVIELPIHITFTDLNASGLTQGDTFVATNKLVDPADRTHVVGHEDDTCTVANPAAARFECTITAFFGRNFVTAQGPFTLGKGGTLSVTGGTGEFRNARGQVNAIDLGHDRADITYRLIP
ncbi:MAG TPA: hypothetical protein VE777_15880 [Gaiellales bacterium]|jgi:hypothetical protein|nr:hypothetical protein [Gaiellales bacterium]